MSSKQRKIAVDLDGTLAHYTKYDGPVPGRPIPRMVERVTRWLQEGHEVYIFTARLSHPDCDDSARKAIQDWVVDVFGVGLPITCTKHYFFDEFWDDRAVSVAKNTGVAVRAL